MAIKVKLPNGDLKIIDDVNEMKVGELLEKLGLLREEYIVTKDGYVITDEDVVVNGDEVVLYAVVSGG